MGGKIFPVEAFEFEELTKRRGDAGRPYQVGDEEHPVAAGSVVFVGAGVEHRFHDIVEELTVVVLFAPPES